MRPISRRIALFSCAGALLSLISRSSRADDATNDAPPNPDDPAGLLPKIRAAREKFHTMETSFTQDRRIGLLATTVRSTGLLTIVRPDRMRWALDAPDNVAYLVTPEGISYRVNGGAAVRAPPGKASASLEDLRALVGGDPGTLSARYVMRARTDDAGRVVVEGTPKTQDPPRPAFVLVVAPDFVSPIHATLKQSAREVTEITFGPSRFDGPVDTAKMR